MLADASSRVFQDASNQERRDYESKYMHEIDDFILPVTTRSVTRAALKKVDEETNDKHMPIAPQALSPNGKALQTMTYDPQPTSTTVDARTSTEHLDNTETGEDNDDTLIVLPTITAKDYDTDEDFANLYRHLQTQELTGKNVKIKQRFYCVTNLL